MKAYWRKGSHHKVDATKAYHELERIRKKEGVLVPAVVINEAKKPRNPLHKEFQWDDTAAAHEFRLYQARNVIRAIQVVRDEIPDSPMRMYEVITQPAVRDAPERKVYDTMDKIMADPLSRDELLARAIRDAVSYRRKYSQLSELAKVFAALDKFILDVDVG